MATGDDAGATAAKELGLADAMAYARELQKEDRLEAADELYRRIIAVAPDYPDAWHFRGMVAFQLGRLAEAETLIRRAVELAPTYSDAHNNLGNVLQHQKRAEEAVTCYERAIALQPDLADAHNNLGNALQQQKRHEEAVALYERAIALRPEMADAHLNLGKALEALDRMAEALTAWQKTTAHPSGSSIPSVWGLRWGQGTWVGDYEHGIFRRSNGAKGSATYEGMGPDGVTFVGYFDTPEAVEAMQFYQDLHRKYKVTPIEAIPQIFETKKAAFMVTPDNRIGELNRLYGEGKFPWGVTEIGRAHV